MAMNPMQRKARTSFLLGALLTLVITGLIIAFLAFQLAETKKKESTIIYKQVCITSQEIGSGMAISENYIIKQIDSSLIPTNALTIENYTTYLTNISTSKINLKAGTILTSDMINTEGQVETADLRLQEYNMIVIPSELKEGEYIDIRLRLPSGEDYIVLSKKFVERTKNDTIWIKVQEQEILTMSNAIVEAYVMDGSVLYATTYTEAGMQNASTPTYVAKNSVIELMNADPNITSTAKNALISRYNSDIGTNRSKINQSLSNYDDGRDESVTSHTKEDIQKQKEARQTYIESLGM